MTTFYHSKRKALSLNKVYERFLIDISNSDSSESEADDDETANNVDQPSKSRPTPSQAAPFLQRTVSAVAEVKQGRSPFEPSLFTYLANNPVSVADVELLVNKLCQQKFSALMMALVKNIGQSYSRGKLSDADVGEILTIGLTAGDAKHNFFHAIKQRIRGVQRRGQNVFGDREIRYEQDFRPYSFVSAGFMPYRSKEVQKSESPNRSKQQPKPEAGPKLKQELVSETKSTSNAQREDITVCLPKIDQRSIIPTPQSLKATKILNREKKNAWVATKPAEVDVSDKQPQPVVCLPRSVKRTVEIRLDNSGLRRDLICKVEISWASRLFKKAAV